MPFSASPSVPFVLDLFQGFALLRSQDGQDFGTCLHLIHHQIGMERRLAVGELTGCCLVKNRGIVGFPPGVPLGVQLLAEGLELGTGVLEDRFYLRDLLVGDIEVVGVSEHVEESLEIAAPSHRAGHGAAPLTISLVGAVGRALGAEDASESNKGGYEDQRNQPISFHESLSFCRCLRRSRVERVNRLQC